MVSSSAALKGHRQRRYQAKAMTGMHIGLKRAESKAELGGGGGAVHDPFRRALHEILEEEKTEASGGAKTFHAVRNFTENVLSMDASLIFLVGGGVPPVEGRSERFARRQTLRRKQPQARSHRLKGLQRRNRMAKKIFEFT